MLEKTSQRFRILFISQFTKELIKNSRPKKFFIENNLQEPIQKSSFLIKETPKKIIHEEEIKSSLMRIPKEFRIRNKFTRFKNQLYIPEPRLPPNLQYLQPTPTNNDVDLGTKLNPLLRDMAVKIIECNGEDEKLIVKGMMGTKFTNIVLSKDEIEQVIEKFSKSAKIPVHEGIFKVVVGRLILTAIISEIISSKFIIKKMTLPIGGDF